MLFHFLLISIAALNFETNAAPQTGLSAVILQKRDSQQTPKYDCPQGFKRYNYHMCVRQYPKIEQNGLQHTDIHVRIHVYKNQPAGSPNTCDQDYERIAAMCYPMCRKRYSGSLNYCRETCKPDETDDGLYCRPYCAPGWKDVLGVCWQGIRSYPRSRNSRRKNEYYRGELGLQCQPGYRKQLLLCYKACTDGFLDYGFGRCVEKCPPGAAYIGDGKCIREAFSTITGKYSDYSYYNGKQASEVQNYDYRSYKPQIK